jgi:pyruvyltransferase
MLETAVRHLRPVPEAIGARLYGRWSPINNFGDLLNPWLIEKITGREPFNIWRSRFVEMSQRITGKPDYAVVGSIVQWCGSHTVVWGTGLMAEDAELWARPLEVRAVRGPLTRERLLSDGIECPPVYGDPALLWPQLLSPEVPTEYALGLVPHYTDKGHELVERAGRSSEVLVIDVERSPEEVLPDMLRCARIASSSLHGLIVADAYGIPSLWVRMRDKVMGGGFKFMDYFASVGHPERQGVDASDGLTVRDLIERAALYEPQIDLDALREACPLPGAQWPTGDGTTDT